MGRKFYIIGGIILLVVVITIATLLFIFHSGSTNFKPVVYQGMAIPYGYSHMEYAPSEVIINGLVISKNLNNNPPQITLGLSPLSSDLPVQRVTIDLDLLTKQTLFTEHKSATQTEYFWTAYSAADLQQLLTTNTPVSAYFKQNAKVPYQVVIHTYLK